MKVRNGLIFLMILVLTAVWLPAAAEEESSVFPFLPGLNWDSSVSEVQSIVNAVPETGGDIGNSGGMAYFVVKDPGLVPVPYELAMTTTAEDEISMLIFLYDVSSASDKDAARSQIVEEMEKLYEGRGNVMFDSPESMKQAFEGKQDNSDTVLATALGGLEGAMKNMYGDMGDIAWAKGWLVNREFDAMVAYSTEGTRENTVAVVILNIARMLAMMQDASLPENRTGCFDLPAGAAWMCSPDDLTAALNNAGLSYEVNNNMYQVQGMKGPSESQMAAMYMFQGNLLMGAVYIPFRTSGERNIPMTFDELEQIMIREYGSKAAVDTESIKQQVQSILGTSATQASVWITTDTLCYLFECAQGNLVMQVSTELLMKQQ